MGWGGTGQLKHVDAQLSPALSSRAAGEGGIRWLASVGLTQPIPSQVLPSLAQVWVVSGLKKGCGKPGQRPNGVGRRWFCLQA